MHDSFEVDASDEAEDDAKLKDIKVARGFARFERQRKETQKESYNIQ